MENQHKKSFRDRRDGWYIGGLDPLHAIMPYVMPTRSANEAVMSEVIDITALTEYINKKNENNPSFKYTWFHAISAALAKVMILRPKMNYFIKGYRFYERKDLTLSFTVKRQFADDSHEAQARILIDRDNQGSLIDQIHDNIEKFVTAVRSTDKNSGIDKQFQNFMVLPRFVFRFFVWVLRVLDYFGLYPEFLAKDDPCYSSIYISNLGSIKMHADYHHLFDWGTNSLFAVIGEKKVRPFWQADGSCRMADSIKLSLTLDERIADGYYYSKSVRLLLHILQHPELLDQDPRTPIELD